VLGDAFLLRIILSLCDGKQLLTTLPLVSSLWNTITKDPLVQRRVWVSFIKPIVERRLNKTQEEQEGLETSINATSELGEWGRAWLNYKIYPDGTFETPRLQLKSKPGRSDNVDNDLLRLHLLLERLNAKVASLPDGRLWMARNCNFGLPCHEDFPIIPLVLKHDTSHDILPVPEGINTDAKKKYWDEPDETTYWDPRKYPSLNTKIKYEDEEEEEEDDEEKKKKKKAGGVVADPDHVAVKTLHELFKTMPEYFFYGQKDGRYELFWEDVLANHDGKGPHGFSYYRKGDPARNEANRQNYRYLKESLEKELEDLCVVRYANFESEEVSFYFLLGRKGSYLAGFWWMVERDS
jgi:hypothetical protein